MRAAIRFATIIMFALLLFTCKGNALCYTNNMDTYQSMATDGTNISVEGEADGSYAMCSIPPGYPPNYVHHTTTASITIKSNSGATRTGSGSTTACPTCYVTVQSNASLAGGSDDDWTVNWSDGVNCNIGGGVWALAGTWSAKLYTEYGRFFSQTPNPPCPCTPTVAIYSLSCSNGWIYAHCPNNGVPPGAKSPQWEETFGNGQESPQYIKRLFLYFQIGGPPHCEPFFPPAVVSGPGVCQ